MKKPITLVTTPDPLVIVVENVLDDDLCDELIAIAERNNIDNYPGLVTVPDREWAFMKSDKRKAFDLYFHECEELQRHESKVHEALETAMGIYRHVCADAPNDHEFEAPRIVKYPDGGDFAPHVDDEYAKNSYCYPGFRWRAVAYIVYLNDCETGMTYFPTKDFDIKPKKGSMILFPTDKRYIHGCSRVEGENKYIIATWMNFSRQMQLDYDEEKGKHKLVQSGFVGERLDSPKAVEEYHRKIREARRLAKERGSE